MAIEVLRDVDLVFDAYRLRGAMNSVKLTDSCDAQEATVFGDTARRRLAGIYSPALDMEGYWDATNDGIIVGDLQLANVPITVAPQDSADGAIAFMFRALAAEYSLLGALGEVNPFSLKAQGSDGARLVRGTVMHNATRTTTGNGTARQLGALSDSQKLYASLHVLSASVADTLDVVIASDDNAGFTSGLTRLTFNTATAVGSQWLTLTGPQTDSYWRVQWTIGGTSPSFSFIVVLGIL